MFTLRFDMRAPDVGAPIGELYGAALEMAAWSEDKGAIVAVLSEHHATQDRHLPSPLVLASAMAARTSTLSIMLAAIVLPFYDTVRVAEDIAVLDAISGGRVSYVLGLGHRVEEYEHFGVASVGRGARMDAQVDQLLRLVRGEPVDIDGRTVTISPSASSAAGPQFLIGGGSPAAARRAGRFGLGFISQAPDPSLVSVYEEACRAAGHQPGFVQLPQPDQTTALFVADDVDRSWAEIGDHLLHDATTAASYRHGETGVASISNATTVDELRLDRRYRIVTVDQAADLVRSGTILPLLPLCGGLPPDTAWPYLERAADAVALAT